MSPIQAARAQRRGGSSPDHVERRSSCLRHWGPAGPPPPGRDAHGDPVHHASPRGTSWPFLGHRPCGTRPAPPCPAGAAAGSRTSVTPASCPEVSMRPRSRAPDSTSSTPSPSGRVHSPFRRACPRGRRCGRWRGRDRRTGGPALARDVLGAVSLSLRVLRLPVAAGLADSKDTFSEASAAEPAAFSSAASRRRGPKHALGLAETHVPP